MESKNIDNVDKMLDIDEGGKMPVQSQPSKKY